MQTSSTRNSKRNIRATATGGLRTGKRNIEIAPVTIIVGSGTTSLPATMPEPPRHPEPSNINPTELKCKRAAIRIVPTRSRTRPYALVAYGKRISEHRSAAAAEIAYAKATDIELANQLS